METTNKYFLSKVLNLKTKKTEKALFVFKHYGDGTENGSCNLDFYKLDNDVKKFVKDENKSFCYLNFNDQNNLIKNAISLYDYDVESLSFDEVNHEYYVDNVA